jgi:hypothetical protein
MLRYKLRWGGIQLHPPCLLGDYQLHILFWKVGVHD